MHRAIVKGGEDHYNDLKLDEKDEAIIEYGKQLAKDANRVSSKLYSRLEAFLSPKEIIDLTVFGALMIVNNVFNAALQIDIDESLDNFKIQPEVAFAGSSHYQPEK
jgi:alkylhydroperoxidase family enzyme